MKKIILGLLILVVAGFSIFSYKKYSKCEKVEFSTAINKQYIYTENDLKTEITLTFLNDRIFGFDGINKYFAGYKIENGKIMFSPIASTMATGPEEKMQLERKYLDLLNNVDKVEVYKNKLLLITKGNQTLKFIENIDSINIDNKETVGPTQPFVETTNAIVPVVEEQEPEINENSIDTDTDLNADSISTETTNTTI